MNGLLPYLLGGGFFVVAVSLLGALMVGLARLKAEDRPRVVVPETPPEPTRVRSGPWSWGATALLVVLGAVLVLLGVHQLSVPPDPLVVKVTAYQFGWKFDYYQTVEAGTPQAETVRDTRRLQAPDLVIQALGVTTNDQLTLPKDVPVLFLVTSLDVIHRFSAPEFLVRRDVVPGQVTAIWVEPRSLGRFKVESDYLCGAGDGVMLAAVDVVQAPDFLGWLAQARGNQPRQTGAPGPSEGSR